ncbi:MAG: ATP-binding protein [Oscillospiraceae bacterium]|jgi:molecular chaperone HtpG|nr:ATP-binding protein [Oscillospiraceae bacterium]
MNDNVIVGVNILEELTTGKYRDSRIIFREYIQNACDQIDAAVRSGLIASGEGLIELWIDTEKRHISIEDNATGIPSSQFRQTLYSIGESAKTLGEDKGFRGIGHWCGIGYCKTLVFTSKVKGEAIESVMTCNAEKMRQMMDAHNLHKVHYTIDDALTATVTFSENKAKDLSSHYFKVEMFNVRDVHTELCVLQQVKDYLSFVAPVGYAPAFYFHHQIHKHAELANQPIQEYNVLVNGEPVLKKYAPSFTTSKGEDKITEVDFHDCKDDDGNLIAWLWFGLSHFQGVLKKENQMRGIRLRTQNIQIGGDDALQKLFKEDRGQYYFIGEVFAIAKDLIPNSQRDYFNENEARVQFERLLSEFFNCALNDIYREGSKINSKYGKIEKAEQLEAEIATTQASGKTVSAEQQQKLEHAQREAENAKQELAKIREKTEEKLSGSDFGTVELAVNEIIKSNEEQRATRLSRPAKPVVPVKPSPEMSDKPVLPPIPSIENAKPDKLVPLSKVRDIICKLTDPATADAIIAKIEKELA